MKLTEDHDRGLLVLVAANSREIELLNSIELLSVRLVRYDDAGAAVNCPAINIEFTTRKKKQA